jgi:hypothetical protein
MARNTRAEPTLTEADLKPTVESLLITTQVVLLTLTLVVCGTGWDVFSAANRPRSTIVVFDTWWIGTKSPYALFV